MLNYKQFLKYSWVIIFVFILTVSTLPVSASNSDSAGYTVETLLPENQKDKSQSYFDLQMSPSGQQELFVMINNHEDKDIIVSVEVISASTDAGGGIDYKTPNIRDESLAFPFSELATVTEPILSVPAKSSVKASVTVQMPAASYEGVILGSIAITKLPEELSNEDAGGVQITNIFSYAVGVVLHESKSVISPDFRVLDVSPKIVNYKSAIEHVIQNPNPIIIKNLDMHLDVYKDDDTQPIWEISKPDVDFAPNSTLYYPLYIPEDTPSIEPGTYTAKTTLAYQGETWSFENSFVVDDTTASEISGQDIVRNYNTSAQNTKGAIPSWIVILLGLVILLMAVAITILLRKNKKTK